MEATISNIGPCRSTVDIVVPAEDVKKEWDQMVKQYAQIARVPGFRPGKAPAKLVLSRYRKDIAAEAQERLLANAYRDAMKEHKISTVAVIDVRQQPVDPEQDFTFSIDIDVEPDFALPEYAISIEGYASQATDAEVEKELASFNLRNAKYTPVEDRAVEAGDFVNIAFEATVDGVPLDKIEPEAKSLARSKSLMTPTDENEILPGVGRGLIGATVGEKVMIGVNFGPDIQLESLKNKEISYQVTVNSINTRTIPELSDEIVKESGSYETVEQFTNAVREHIEKRRESDEHQRRLDLVCSYLLGLVEFDVSETERREETSELVQSIVRQNINNGVKEDILKEKHAEIYASAAKQADNNVRLRYILDAIAATLDLDITEKEIMDYIRQIAMYNPGKKPNEMYEQVVKNGRITRIKTQLRNSKTLEKLLENADVTIIERPVIEPEQAADDNQDDIEEV